MAEFISLGELIDALTLSIEEVRSSTDGEAYIELNESVAALEEIHFTRRNKDNNVLTVFNTYEQLIKISMTIRSLLSKIGIIANQYNSLDYGIYYKGERYFAKKVATNQMTVTKSGLMLHLDKVVEDLRNEIQSDLAQSIAKLINTHYQQYANYAANRYVNNTNSSLYGRVNMGHVAESFERHLQEHHQQLYIWSLNPSIEDSPSGMIQMHINELSRTISSDIPAGQNEGEDDVKYHLIGSLGYQRGTVAGDVRSTQVKEGLWNQKDNDKAKSASVRLTSIYNLKLGIKTFAPILNPEVPAQRVAMSIAIYISDIIDEPARNVLNQRILPRIYKEELNIEDITKYLNIPINL